MFQIFNNRKFLLFFAVIFLIITWIMFVTSRERPEESKVEYILNTAITPLEHFFTYVSGAAGDSWNTLYGLARLKVENERLQEQLNYAQAQQLGYKNLRLENKRLRDALRFEQSQVHDLIPAEIISVSPNDWSYTFIINKGRNYAIQKGMAVISPKGVVGRIGEVRSGTAEVILISDSREGNYIGGVVKRTDSMVIVNGGGKSRGQCSIRPAIDSYFLDIKKNDLVITGDTSEWFPSGVPIGRVVSVNKGNNNMTYHAYLKPVVNLSKLQFVYVVKLMKRPPQPIGKQAINHLIDIPSPAVTDQPIPAPMPTPNDAQIPPVQTLSPESNGLTPSGPEGQ